MFDLKKIILFSYLKKVKKKLETNFFKKMSRRIEKSNCSIEVEKFHNISGSTAGAGSGEFHNYRVQRGRERARQLIMEKEAQAVLYIYI